jgi:hypothetical protein
MGAPVLGNNIFDIPQPLGDDLDVHFPEVPCGR